VAGRNPPTNTVGWISWKRKNGGRATAL